MFNIDLEIPYILIFRIFRCGKITIKFMVKESI